MRIKKTETIKKQKANNKIKWRLVDSKLPLLQGEQQFPDVYIDDMTYTFKRQRELVKDKRLVHNIKKKIIKISKKRKKRKQKKQEQIQNDYKLAAQLLSTVLGVQVSSNIFDEKSFKEEMINVLSSELAPDFLKYVYKVPLEEKHLYQEKIKGHLKQILECEDLYCIKEYLKKITDEEDIDTLAQKLHVFVKAAQMQTSEHEWTEETTIYKEIEVNPELDIKGQVVNLEGIIEKFHVKAPNPVYWTWQRIKQWEKIYRLYNIISPHATRYFYTIIVTPLLALGLWLFVMYFIYKWSWSLWGSSMGSSTLFGGSSYVYGYRPFSWLPITFASSTHYFAMIIISFLVALFVGGLIWKIAKMSLQALGSSDLQLYIEKILKRKYKTGLFKTDLMKFSIPQYGYDNSLSHTLVWGRTGTGKTATILMPTIIDRAAREGIVFFFDPKYDSKGLFPLYRNVYPFSLTSYEGYTVNLFDFMNITGQTTLQDYIKLGEKITSITAGTGEKERFWRESAIQRVIVPLLRIANEHIDIPFGWTGLLYQVISEVPELANKVFDEGIARVLQGGGHPTDGSILSIATTPLKALEDQNIISLFSYSSLTYTSLTLPSTFVPIGWNAQYQDSTPLQLAASLIFYVIDRVVTQRYFRALAEGISVKKLPPVTVIIDELQNLPRIQELSTFVTLYRGYGVQLIFSIQAFAGMISENKYNEKEGINIVANAPMKVLLPQGTEEEELTKMLNALVADFAGLNYSVGSTDTISKQKLDMATDKIVSALSNNAYENLFTPIVIEKAPTHQAVSIVKTQYIPAIKESLEKVANVSFKQPKRVAITPQVLSNIKVEILTRLGV